MSRFFESRTSVCNLISIVLMIILLVCQFTPFWTYGENGETASIQDYIWNPTEYGDLEKYFKAEVSADYDINSILLMPILVLVLAVAGAVTGGIKIGHAWVGAFPAVCGLVGVWGYLSKAVFQMGSHWGLHLALCVVLLIIGVFNLVDGYKSEFIN